MSRDIFAANIIIDNEQYKDVQKDEENKKEESKEIENKEENNIINNDLQFEEEKDGNDVIDDIEEANKSQNSGAMAIKQTINELSTVVQENASFSEELAATAEELSSQARNLQTVISFFK